MSIDYNMEDEKIDMRDQYLRLIVYDKENDVKSQMKKIKYIYNVIRRENRKKRVS